MWPRARCGPAPPPHKAAAGARAGAGALPRAAAAAAAGGAGGGARGRPAPAWRSGRPRGRRGRRAPGRSSPSSASVSGPRRPGGSGPPPRSSAPRPGRPRSAPLPRVPAGAFQSGPCARGRPPAPLPLPAPACCALGPGRRLWPPSPGSRPARVRLGTARGARGSGAAGRRGRLGWAGSGFPPGLAGWGLRSCGQSRGGRVCGRLSPEGTVSCRDLGWGRVPGRAAVRTPGPEAAASVTPVFPLCLLDPEGQARSAQSGVSGGGGGGWDLSGPGTWVGRTPALPRSFSAHPSTAVRERGRKELNPQPTWLLYLP